MVARKKLGTLSRVRGLKERTLRLLATIQLEREDPFDCRMLEGALLTESRAIDHHNLDRTRSVTRF